MEFNLLTTSAMYENLTEDPTELIKDYDVAVSVVIPLLFGIIFVIGLLGNTMVVVVVIKEKKMRKTINVFLLNLSVVDLIFIITVVPFTAYSHASPDSSWIFGNEICKLTNYLVFVMIYFSVYTLSLIALDRYLAVVYPIQTVEIRTVRNAFICVLVLWVIVLTAFIHFLFLYETKTVDGLIYCNAFEMGQKERKGFVLQFVMTSYLLPLVFIAIIYFCIWRKIYRSDSPIRNKSTKTNHRQRKVTTMLLIVVFVFAISWLPIQVVLLIINFDSEGIATTSSFRIAHYFANCASYANSCVNPIIYTWVSKSYRDAFQRALGCKPKKTRLHYSYARSTVENGVTSTSIT